MSILDKDIEYYITEDDRVLFERNVFTELVYRIQGLEKENERLKHQLKVQEDLTIKNRLRKHIYKSRCEKAIELLKSVYMLDNVTITNNACDKIDNAINILQNGGDKE